MLASESDLFACGHKIYIPSPGTKGALPTQTQPQESPLKTSKQLSPLRGHLKELGKSLSFNDEVVTEVSPHLLSYAKSKKLVEKSLFRASSIGIRTRTQRPTNQLIGRHSCRGDMKRHVPCNLASVLDAGQTNEKLLPRSDWPTVHVGTVPLPLSSPSPTKKPPNNIFATVEGKRIKELYTEDPSDNLLVDKSSYQLLQQNPITSHSLFLDRMESPPVRNYLGELQDGARPLHQKMADRTELVLDNGAKFDAVVQESFPRSPSEWCAESETQKKETKISNVKGYRKWLDFPQPAQVS